MVAFKKELLTCCLGTDEGEVTEYLGCELLCTVQLKRQKLAQKAYTERVLGTFGMWDCKLCIPPLDANSRLSKKDCPQPVVCSDFGGDHDTGINDRLPEVS